MQWALEYLLKIRFFIELCFIMQWALEYLLKIWFLKKELAWLAVQCHEYLISNYMYS